MCKSCWHIWILSWDHYAVKSLLGFGESYCEKEMQIKGGWGFLGLWHLTLVSAGVGLCEAGFDCPALVFVTCPYFSACVCSSWLVQLFYGLCFIFSLCSSQRDVSEYTTGPLWRGGFVVFAVPVGRRELQPSLVLCLLLKPLKFICLLKFQHVDLENHFSERGKALEGGEQFKEVNLTLVNLLFTLLFSPEVSPQLSTTLQAQHIS